MNRYQIALQDGDLEHQVIFSFPPTHSAKKVLRYVHYCIEKKGIFSTEGIPVAVMDDAIVSTSRDCRAPILVKTESEARAMAIAHSYKGIFSMEKGSKLPVDSRPICYGSLPPEGFSPLLVVHVR